MGIKGERINAVKSKQGAIGCTLSHIRCLELAKQRNYEYVCIMEDDILFTNPEVFKQQIKKFSENSEINWDVLLIGSNVVPPYQKIEGDYCVRILNAQTTLSYIVKKEMYDILIENFKESAKLQMQNSVAQNTYNPYAIDLYWKKLQYQYYWYIITPLTVTQFENYSDIEGKVTNYNHLMLDMEKEWLIRNVLMNLNNNKNI